MSRIQATPQFRVLPITDAARETTGLHLALEISLPCQLSILSNRISHAIDRDYEERVGLTVPEWLVIEVLIRSDPDSTEGVCDQATMDKAIVSPAMIGLS